MKASPSTEKHQADLQADNERISRLNADLEQRVRERDAQLEAINKELEAFCYSVSHDLRAPLRSIRVFSEALLERYADKLDARGQDFLRRACDSSEHMEKLLEDLLSLSRWSRGELTCKAVHLTALAHAIVGELRQAEPDRAVEFVAAPDLLAQGDERMLRAVLDKLLGNAWKFTSKQPHARIELGAVHEPRPAFFVRDNGAGFDMVHAGKFFGVFQRLHSASEFAGTGVGLATVQRIIARHGGQTWGVGAVNQGATFYFTVPEQGKEWATSAEEVPASPRNRALRKEPVPGRTGLKSNAPTKGRPLAHGPGLEPSHLSESGTQSSHSARPDSRDSRRVAPKAFGVRSTRLQ